MSFRSVRSAQAAMAAPAILLFLVMCLAQIFGGSGSVEENHSINNGEEELAEENNGHVRGSSSGSNSVDIQVDSDSEDGIISVEHHHGHGKKKNHNGYSGQEPANDDTSKNDSSFDYYAYSMSFQPEFCRENNEKFTGCQHFQENWEGQLTIHGLWPNRSDGTWPQMCTNEKLDMSLLQDLGDDLETRWPNVKAALTSKSHAAFWEHEWSKHGTCSGLSQHDYFATALDLLLPTPAVVKENYGSVVKRKDLEEGYLGSDMSVFVCKYGYLSEVRVCLEKMPDMSVGERVTCPEANLKADNCGDEIKIASFTQGRVSAEIE